MVLSFIIYNIYLPPVGATGVNLTSPLILRMGRCPAESHKLGLTRSTLVSASIIWLHSADGQRAALSRRRSGVRAPLESPTRKGIVYWFLKVFSPEKLSYLSLYYRTMLPIYATQGYDRQPLIEDTQRYQLSKSKNLVEGREIIFILGSSQSATTRVCKTRSSGVVGSAPTSPTIVMSCRVTVNKHSIWRLSSAGCENQKAQRCVTIRLPYQPL